MDMDATLTPAERAFRDEVRAFFADRLTPDIRRAGNLMTSVYADHAASMRWQRILQEKGWAAPAWPVEHGGCAWTPMQHYIFTRERVAAGAPPTSPMGIQMVAPAIIHFGTDAQKSFFLPRMLTGEHFWCQGYSEPDSGSDLASLRMAGIEDGEDFLCSGSKIWTTHAGDANWIFCLIRTAREARPQQGITFILMDMRTSGITVKPLTMLTGEQVQYQIFFDNVRVPKANVLGRIGDGWRVAKYLLEFERGGSAYAPELQARAAALHGALERPHGDGRPGLLDDPLFATRLAAARIRIDVLETLELQIMASLSNGGDVGSSASVMKVLGTELSQHLTELALEAAGRQALPYQPRAAAPGGPVPYLPSPENDHISGQEWQAIAPLRYLNERAGSIYAGSNEIQRNIIGKMEFGF